MVYITSTAVTTVINDTSPCGKSQISQTCSKSREAQFSEVPASYNLTAQMCSPLGFTQN